MKLKVCGMRDQENISGLAEIAPDFMGFIFYPKSPRFAGVLKAEALTSVPSSIKKTGVFVNAPVNEILSQVDKYRLEAVQLHGDESVEVAKELKQRGLTVIKVFRIAGELPDSLGKYEEAVDYFLFDTKAEVYGGTGHHFDWSALESYTLKTPYFLSGGIAYEDMDAIKALSLSGLVGIDVNSKFEIEPGLKDLGLLKKLKERI